MIFSRSDTFGRSTRVCVLADYADTDSCGSFDTVKVFKGLEVSLIVNLQSWTGFRHVLTDFPTSVCLHCDRRWLCSEIIKFCNSVHFCIWQIYCQLLRFDGLSNIRLMAFWQFLIFEVNLGQNRQVFQVKRTKALLPNQNKTSKLCWI